jgi:hypothetical protein
LDFSKFSNTGKQKNPAVGQGFTNRMDERSALPVLTRDNNRSADDRDRGFPHDARIVSERCARSMNGFSLADSGWCPDLKFRVLDDCLLPLEKVSVQKNDDRQEPNEECQICRREAVFEPRNRWFR